MEKKWCSEEDYMSLKAVKDSHPGWEKIVKVVFGWWVFYDLEDFRIWSLQK